ncbi:hypothetical protein M409DRAFT_15742 [Zasmidium cellare ATCC 36951]|uniref:Uncharacterized protein n=1 Tax=Zasmidium cellare ATCC 36951 TaxID=1080233 RepID=A0A6A6D514_ZASCE|nr:uncharacterized protein M409DRAFT_15742 [Zasmidium cellare ATCC 36951]KAF2173460.1 hypothetical protein M409DRAFT_15742 [Zasmidium cellare ATCC 36951]
MKYCKLQPKEPKSNVNVIPSNHADICIDEGIVLQIVQCLENFYNSCGDISHAPLENARAFHALVEVTVVVRIEPRELSIKVPSWVISAGRTVTIPYFNEISSDLETYSWATKTGYDVVRDGPTFPDSADLYNADAATTAIRTYLRKDDENE